MAIRRQPNRYDVLGLLTDIDDGLTRPNVSDASRIRYVRLVVARFKACHIDGLSSATLADWARDGIDAAALAAGYGNEAPIHDAGARVIPITTATAIEPGPPIGLIDDTDEAARAAARNASTV